MFRKFSAFTFLQAGSFCIFSEACGTVIEKRVSISSGHFQEQKFPRFVLNGFTCSPACARLVVFHKHISETCLTSLPSSNAEVLMNQVKVKAAELVSFHES